MYALIDEAKNNVGKIILFKLDNDYNNRAMTAEELLAQLDTAYDDLTEAKKDETSIAVVIAIQLLRDLLLEPEALEKEEK